MLLNGKTKRPMKILLLQPPSPPLLNIKRDLAGGMGVADPSKRARFGHDPGYITMPYLSLLQTAGVLERDGYEVEFLDAQSEDLGKNHVITHIDQAHPDLVVQLLNLPSLYGDLEILKGIRETIRGIRTVAVGPVTIPLFQEIASSGAVDAIVRGDPEIILPSLLSAFKASSTTADTEIRNGVLTNRQIRHVENLDDLPPVPYHLIEPRNYWYFPFGQGVSYASIFASRGCSYRCYYCPYPMGFGDKIVSRDPVRVIDEIERLYHERGIKCILFRDQVFTADRDRTLALCNEILKRNLKLSWVVETRLDTVDEALVRRMKEAGCIRMHFGIESGDPTLFDKMGKQGARGTLEQFLQNFQMVEQLGVAAHMFVLVGLLGETWSSVQNTIAAVRRLKPLTLQVSVVTPYPGTGLFEQAKRKGLLLTEDFAKYTGFQPVSRTEHMSADELLQARQMIIEAHQKAVFWKKRRHLAALAVQYARDGSLYSRLRRRYHTWAMVTG